MNVARETDRWIDAVEQHDAEAVARLFSPDGILIGTLSQIQRRGEDIKRYFDYFVNLPGITVLSKTYNIVGIAPNVFLYLATLSWTWQGLEAPLTARMSFLYQGPLIYHLHSSAMPPFNPNFPDREI